LRTHARGRHWLGRDGAETTLGSWADMGKLACVADSSPEAARKTGEKYSVSHFTDYQELLRSDIDAVFVVTPTGTHEKIGVV